MNTLLASSGKAAFWKLAPFLPDELRLKILFLKEHGSWPNLAEPRTFSEKVQWRKLHDRRALLTMFADKYGVREYVAGKVGEKYLTRLYWASSDPATMPFDDLPQRFVVKANHGTRWNILVKDKREVSRDALVAQLAEWLRSRYPALHCEWGYRNIAPMALAEEYLSTAAGDIPPDYKFFVFGGRVRMIQVDLDRFTAHSRCLYDPQWNLLPVVLGYPKGVGIQRPENLDEMIWCAEQCSGGVDFVRVDLYNVDGRIVFGELTNYPGGGLERITPASFDAELGSWWKLG